MASSLCEGKKDKMNREVDLFGIPHLRMKQLVQETSSKVFEASRFVLWKKNPPYKITRGYEQHVHQSFAHSS